MKESEIKQGKQEFIYLFELYCMALICMESPARPFLSP